MRLRHLDDKEKTTMTCLPIMHGYDWSHIQHKATFYIMSIQAIMQQDVSLHWGILIKALQRMPYLIDNSSPVQKLDASCYANNTALLQQ